MPKLQPLIVLSIALPLVLSAEESHPWPSTVASGVQLEKVYEDPRFFEGPTWSPREQKLYFTAFGKDKQDTCILRLEEPGRAIVWADNTEGVNGTALSRSGEMLGAQAFGHRILSYRLGGAKPKRSRVVMENLQLNQPNDVCEAPNGDLYFTDPDFANHRTSAVYLLRKRGELVRLITEMTVPNGIKLSPDAKTLYVGDSHEKLWRAYPVMPNGITGPGRIFFDPATENRADPDGMTVDEHGNLYLSGRGGVWVVSSAGTSLGLIPIPEFCSNATFGDPDGKGLYLTCDKRVYHLRMKVRGVVGSKKNAP